MSEITFASSDSLKKSVLVSEIKTPVMYACVFTVWVYF